LHPTSGSWAAAQAAIVHFPGFIASIPFLLQSAG
jgi:hypothetical protein